MKDFFFSINFEMEWNHLSFVKTEFWKTSMVFKNSFWIRCILSLIYRSVDFNLKVTMENFDPKYDIINEFRFVFSLHSTTFLTNLIITRLNEHSIFYKWNRCIRFSKSASNKSSLHCAIAIHNFVWIRIDVFSVPAWALAGLVR